MNLFFNAFPQEVVSTIGWTLLHSLWQGGVISVALYLILYILRHKNANLKTMISVAAMVLFVVSSVLTFSILSGTQDTGFPSGAVYAENVMTYVPAASEAALNNEPALSSIYLEVRDYLNEHLDFVFTIWLLGLTVYVVRFFGGMLYTMRIRSNAIPVENGRWYECINRLRCKINLKKPVEFAESGNIKVPVAMGFLKPIILFPFGLLSGLPQEQIEAIIIHEIAHIKRHDVVINIFQSLVEIIFFFNPFIWWISGKIRMEREYCCDDIAINQCGDELVYAKALANLESLTESNMPLFAVPLFKNHNQLLRRINRMLHQNQNQSNLKEKFAAVIIFIGILVSAAVFKNANAQTVSFGNNAGIAGSASVITGEAYFPASIIDTTKSKKGTLKMNFEAKVNGETKEFRVNLKNNEIVSLFIDDEKIPKEEYGKYSDIINKRVKEHEAAMIQHEIDMKKHAEDMKQHEIDMKKHEIEMKQLQKDLQKAAVIREEEMIKHQIAMKQHEKEMAKHELDMKQHNIDMEKFQQDRKQHEKDMAKHELDMKQHEKDMKVHEAEMKKHNAFMKAFKQMLIDEKLIDKNDTNISYRFTSSKLIVEGKEASASVLIKAKKLYKEHFNKEIDSNSSVSSNYSED